jgi:hypothetical protein
MVKHAVQILVGTIASSLLASSVALADPPVVVGATNAVDPSGQGGSATATATGPGTVVSAPIGASGLGAPSGAPSASTPSTQPPTTTSHAAAPIDSSGTAVNSQDQTIEVHSASTTAGASESDPSSAGMIATFCVLGDASEQGTPTVTFSSVCGDTPSTVGSGAATQPTDTGTGNGAANGSACLTGSATANTPPSLVLGTTCGTAPSGVTSGIASSDMTSGAEAEAANKAATGSSQAGSPAGAQGFVNVPLLGLPSTSTAGSAALLGLAFVAAGALVILRQRFATAMR